MSDVGLFLSVNERVYLRNLMRKRKVEALVQRRANALLLLDTGWSELNVANALFLDVSTIKEWLANFQRAGLSSVRMSKYSLREGHLSSAQEQELITYFNSDPPRDSCEVRGYVERAYGVTFSRSGAIALMRRLGFVYKKPKPVPRFGDETEQRRHINAYEALNRRLEANEAIVFADAVHPEHQSRPAFGWFHKDSKPTLKTCLLYTSPSPRDGLLSRMPSSA